MLDGFPQNFDYVSICNGEDIADRLTNIGEAETGMGRTSAPRK